MAFYVVTINGEVADVAYLSDEDGVALRAFVAGLEDSGRGDRIYVIEQTSLTTSLSSVKSNVEQQMESWQ